MKNKKLLAATLGLGLLASTCTPAKTPVTIQGNMTGTSHITNMENSNKSKIISIQLLTGEGIIECYVANPKEGRFTELLLDWDEDINESRNNINNIADIETVTGYMNGGKCYMKSFEINDKTYKFD
ncbi:MAG: hypothetical protein KKA79_07445 [Nanoarchaeota archaeon]|nr:hypothetical protein [Nanoarchaeota archaeon]MCG2717450.1 hypothetical protein [Nanoarchaeota archaeon]